MKRLCMVFVVVSILSLLFFSQAMATLIIYDVTDLGGGTWEYSYTVSENLFQANYGFTTFFDYGLYDNIIPVSHGADWDVLTWNPQLLPGNVEQAGAYDALALFDSASLVDPFIVRFSWLGGGTPDAQYFEVYDPSWTIIETGTTTPVPEPATIFLFIIGLPVFLYKKKERLV